MLAIKPPDTIFFMVNASLEQQLKALPNNTGVYLLKDAYGSVIYVGKAANLKKRTRNHFNTSSNLTLKTRHLMLATSNLDYFVTDSAQQALILECNLIKKFNPRYNVRLKDGKTFPYLKININEYWPDVHITRRRTRNGAMYFGPFASAGSVRKTLKLIKKIFHFRSCSKYIDGTSKRPCLKYYIHNCLGPCIGAVSKDEYREMINQVILFLEGRQELVLQGLFQNLKTATRILEFEKAASIRDQIQAVQKVIEGQKIAIELNGEQDVIAFAQNLERAYVEIFFIRNDKLVGHDHFIMEGICGDNPSEIITGFVKQYYSNAAYIPPMLLLQHDV
ncbi:excinuclease ABC subunit C, partial [bacterium]|nr:excinuclease ABC subunit C [bacterium]